MIDSETHRRYSAAVMTAALLPSCRRHDGGKARVIAAVLTGAMTPSVALA